MSLLESNKKCNNLFYFRKRHFNFQKAENSRIQQQITSLKGEKTALQQQLLGLQRRITELEMQVGSEGH